MSLQQGCAIIIPKDLSNAVVLSKMLLLLNSVPKLPPKSISSLASEDIVQEGCEGRREGS